MVDEKPSMLAPAALAATPGAAERRPRVLAVDDIRANLTLIEAVLADLDCEVVCATSGGEALRLLLEDEFALMLLDVQMPEMDGYEVAELARGHRRSRDLPILFVTAADCNDQSALKGYGSGAVDFLFKPIVRDVLRSKVRVFLELYVSRRQVTDAKLEQEKAYQELKTTQTQLVQAAKMASLGELVAGVAHEINNPLAYSISHLATVKRALVGVVSKAPALEPDLAKEWQRASDRLQAIEIGLERIRELVVKLHTFSRLDDGECGAVNLRECLNAIVTILQHRIEGRITVEMRIGTPDVIRCARSLLNQGVMNLISNAIDAIDGPGTISIRTTEEDADYVISVADTGRGIPEEIRERVFEPFFTTKPIGQGTGLGLSIAYSIVRKHGGSLELSPSAPSGTVATIRLPKALARMPSTRAAPSR